MLGRLLLNGATLTFLTYNLIPWINFISSLTALPTAIALMLFLEMDRVTMNLLSVQLLLTCLTVLLDMFKLISGTIRCERMWNKLWGGREYYCVFKYKIIVEY